MAIYRIYPEKDSFIWSLPNDAGKYGNAGLDEVVEIGGFPDSDGLGRTNRTLIQFRTKDITAAFDNKISGLFSASINLQLAEGSNLPTSFKVEQFPVSQSWQQGIGKRANDPMNFSGCTWQYRNGEQSNAWDNLGGDKYAIHSSTIVSSSQLHDLTSDYDLNIDVTNAIDLISSGSIPNNGFMLKIEDKYEANTTSSINLKYFSSNTNTIFPPYLEFKWDDTVYSSSLSELSTDIATVNIKNSKPQYIDSDIVRFRLTARPKYPTRTFSTSSVYLTEHKLPANSYWGIKDEYSGEMIVDFDTTYTKISADDTSSYLDVYMDSLQPERFYRLLIKTTLNNSTFVLDNKNIFKVVKHG